MDGLGRESAGIGRIHQQRPLGTDANAGLAHSYPRSSDRDDTDRQKSPLSWRLAEAHPEPSAPHKPLEHGHHKDGQLQVVLGGLP
jgi:hypothetical protein